jgi:hypothetical protein
MQKVKERGHLHLIGIAAVLLIGSAFWILLDWRQKLYSLHDQIVSIEQRLEVLDNKLKVLELRVDVSKLPVLPDKK